jgi:type II secretory pathway component PulF
MLLRELATLLGVGATVLDALDTIARQHSGRFQTIVVLLRDRVAAGRSLAAAMREQPAIFDELAISVTEVGEDAGTLDISLERLGDFRERWEQLRGRIVTALIYPAIVLLVALFASLFLMSFVVPRILQPLIEAGQTLPLPTRIVKSVSDFLLDWWWLLVPIVIALVAAAAVMLKSTAGRKTWDRLMMRIPIVGALVQKQAVVRMSVVISTLLRSGIVFIRAIEIAQRGIGNTVLRDALAQCGRDIAAGADIGPAMAKSRAFSPMVVQMFTLGQQSGRLEEMLDRLAAAYDREVSTAATRLAAILEPVLIILLAVLVLFIIMATILPILEAGNAIQ